MQSSHLLQAIDSNSSTTHLGACGTHFSRQNEYRHLINNKSIKISLTECRVLVKYIYNSPSLDIINGALLVGGVYHNEPHDQRS